jgi:hypothetical protein
MRAVLATLFVLAAGSAFSGAALAEGRTSAQPVAAVDAGRWCSISSSDNARNCYFKRHQDCMKAIADGSGVCVPNESNRGEMPEDPENNSK